MYISSTVPMADEHQINWLNREQRSQQRKSVYEYKNYDQNRSLCVLSYSVENWQHSSRSSNIDMPVIIVMISKQLNRVGPKSFFGVSFTFAHINPGSVVAMPHINQAFIHCILRMDFGLVWRKPEKQRLNKKKAHENTKWEKLRRRK